MRLDSQDKRRRREMPSSNLLQQFPSNSRSSNHSSPKKAQCEIENGYLEIQRPRRDLAEIEDGAECMVSYIHSGTAFD